MTHRTQGRTRDCKGCRFWSEMLAKSEGGPVQALCLAPHGNDAPRAGKYTSGTFTCAAWKSGHLGAVDDPPDYGEATRAAYEAEEQSLRPQPQKPSAGEFSVCQFFEDGSCEYVRRFVDAKEAVETAKRSTESVGARIGTTRRVIITDGGDCTNFEWKFGEGVVYPPNDGTRFVADPKSHAP